MILSFSEEAVYVLMKQKPQIKSQALPYKIIDSAVCAAHCHHDDIMRWNEIKALHANPKLMDASKIRN